MWLFLLSVMLISLSGVMMPGPMLAVTVAKSHRPFAGAFVALGHGVVEIPLMILIYFGLASFLQQDLTRTLLGITGGAVLIYLGITMLRAKGEVSEASLVHSPFVAGIITSLLNPFFLFWWLTVGAMLIEKALKFGRLGFLLFIPAHWTCDLVWLSFVSLGLYKTRALWWAKAQRGVLVACALVLLGFGGWFIVSSL